MDAVVSNEGRIKMCNKCTDKKKYWVHIADKWTSEETREMVDYLLRIRYREIWKREKESD